LVSKFKKEGRWRVLENTVLKKMFEPDREEVTGALCVMKSFMV
jgi:hypothetical protein